MNITGTTIIALWGAILATLVLIWDIYKWRTAGAKLRFTCRPNMKFYGGSIPDDKTYIYAEVVNTGDRPTTITNIAGEHYLKYFDVLIKKPETSMVFIPKTNQSIPHVLKPGERWIGSIEQTEENVEMARNGYFYFLLCHSQNKKWIKNRIQIEKKSNG